MKVTKQSWKPCDHAIVVLEAETPKEETAIREFRQIFGLDAGPKTITVRLTEAQ